MGGGERSVRPLRRIEGIDVIWRRLNKVNLEAQRCSTMTKDQAELLEMMKGTLENYMKRPHKACKSARASKVLLHRLMHQRWNQACSVKGEG